MVTAPASAFLRTSSPLAAQPLNAAAPTSPVAAAFGTVAPSTQSNVGQALKTASPVMPASVANYSTSPPVVSQPQNSGPAPTPAPTQMPQGFDMANPGVGEQAFNSTQNRLQEDPFQNQMVGLAGQAGQPSQGENYLNQNLGTLNGPGQGSQYWNQQQGQFNNPLAGEQFARQATQGMNPQGPASAFFNNAMGQYNDFTGFQGAGNSQNTLNQNSASGPLAGQQFYNQVQGDYGTTGRYTDPNLAAGQYQQTQQSFGALPTPDSADPFYDRAIQLGMQTYNQGAASRGVYGSSEALNGVGNIITDLNAQRAQAAFGNNMQIAQENRARQQLLGEQARQGDLSSLSAFGANLSGVETFGNLANAAGNQTLGQQTMLGNQAANADQAAQAAQNSNISGLNAFGQLSGQADTAETNRFGATTNAMNQADRTAIDRLQTGANIANQVDTTNRQNFDSQNQAAQAAGQLQNNRLNTAANIASTGSQNDLNRLQAFNNAALGAQGAHDQRSQGAFNNIQSSVKQLQSQIGANFDALQGLDQKAFDDKFTAEIAPKLQAAGYAARDIDNLRQTLFTVYGKVT